MIASEMGLGWFSGNLIETLPAAVYVCDAEAGVVAFNERVTELWGRAPDVGQTNERFCGSHKLVQPNGTFLPYTETPTEWVRRGSKRSGRHRRKTGWIARNGAGDYRPYLR